jgi:voltage-gated potassium channel
MDERALRWQQRFEWPMVIAALLVIPLLVIEDSNLGEPWDTIGVILNWGTWLAFAAELVVMLYVTPRPMEWVKRNPWDVAATLLSPPFVPGSLAAARLFRLFRLFRLVPLFRMRNLLSLDGVRYAAFFTVMIVLIGGAVFAEIERDQDLSIWDGIWWSVTTVTTVGYGDIPTTTDTGRVIAMIVMAAGIGFVALLTAFAADRFIRKAEAVGEQEEIVAKLVSVSERLERIERRLDRGG